MASYDGDSTCHSDEDEDDGTSPVYATCSLAHGVKNSRRELAMMFAVIYPILRPGSASLSRLLH